VGGPRPRRGECSNGAWQLLWIVSWLFSRVYRSVSVGAWGGQRGVRSGNGIKRTRESGLGGDSRRVRKRRGGKDWVWQSGGEGGLGCLGKLLVGGGGKGTVPVCVCFGLWPGFLVRASEGWCRIEGGVAKGLRGGGGQGVWSDPDYYGDCSGGMCLVFAAVQEMSGNEYRNPTTPN